LRAAVSARHQYIYRLCNIYPVIYVFSFVRRNSYIVYDGDGNELLVVDIIVCKLCNVFFLDVFNDIICYHSIFIGIVYLDAVIRCYVIRNVLLFCFAIVLCIYKSDVDIFATRY